MMRSLMTIVLSFAVVILLIQNYHFEKQISALQQEKSDVYRWLGNCQKNTDYKWLQKCLQEINPTR